jgi:hypothetical protein
VGRTAERVGLDDLAGLQRTGDIADTGACAAESYRELGRGLRMGGDSGEPANHVPDRTSANRIQQVLAQSPRQSLIPAQRHQRRLIVRRLQPDARGRELTVSIRFPDQPSVREFADK